ncbi:hypothetical protein [Blastopirellula marina]|uniref:Uncharacterized protein n=1 Tax=Blastopirellula marina DSM 3645 TaxID=314230 RepID=A3ZUZ0_9BACT|nr:hypothetical protein [Blastopirellula marina]EAQ79726.1 hypothetical protein DSM3645_24495 [Blastopirellula marina DSM 3645]
MTELLEIIDIGDAKFSCGYRVCQWRGEIFEFSEQAAAAVRVLAESHQAGVPAVYGGMLLDELAKLDMLPNRVDEIFRTSGKRHPAWDRMIKRVGRNTYRLEISGEPQKSHTLATVPKSDLGQN